MHEYFTMILLTCVVLWFKETQRTHKICELGVKFSLFIEIKQLYRSDSVYTSANSTDVNDMNRQTARTC